MLIIWMFEYVEFLSSKLNFQTSTYSFKFMKYGFDFHIYIYVYSC